MRALLDATLLTASRHERFVDDALIVTSELVSNADRHGGGATHFGAEVVGGALWLSVGDDSPRRPRTQPPDATLPGGFGWLMVQRLCSSVVINAEGKGKTITAILALP